MLVCVEIGTVMDVAVEVADIVFVKVLNSLSSKQLGFDNLPIYSPLIFS